MNPDFQFRIVKNHVKIKFYNKKKGTFEVFKSSIELLNPSTGSLITRSITPFNSFSLLSCKSSKSTRFVFYVAILRDQTAILTLKGIYTPENGLRFNKCHETMHCSENSYAIPDMAIFYNALQSLFCYLNGWKWPSISMQLQKSHYKFTKRHFGGNSITIV